MRQDALVEVEDELDKLPSGCQGEDDQDE